MRRSIIVLTVIILLASACSPLASQSNPKTGPIVLASTTLLADMARNVAGDRVQVDSLLPIGADPHGYQPTPSDVVKISKSTLLIVNGLGYEQFMNTLLENAGGNRDVIEATAGLSPRKDAGLEHGIDPHMWLDPNNVIVYVENIRDALIHADPNGVAIYKANADAYIAQLKTLDTWIIEQVNRIPATRRLLVTNHEALGYFADRYGFTVIGAVVPGFSTDAAPSAQQMAGLIDLIKSSGAPAIFLGQVESDTLAAQIANETSAKVVSDLYLESLTEGTPAATYIDMMKHNATRIVEALK
ncbi:MAG: zinc ABC transporter substrate-binding protein [Anaerolineales bacterium]|nr:zinc ABC transporter substrate-binding protein [Anaerolineales bacterium]